MFNLRIFTYKDSPDAWIKEYRFICPTLKDAREKISEKRKHFLTQGLRVTFILRKRG